MRDRHDGAVAGREQFIECGIRRHGLNAQGSGVVAGFEYLAYEGFVLAAAAEHGDLGLFQRRQRFDLLALGGDQQQHVVFQNRDGAGAGREPGIGPQHHEIGLFAVELRDRLGIIGIRHDLEAKF
jgi:hypothetical protein